MLLEKLCNAASPSGYEGEVREIIKNEIKNNVDEVKIDRMGNIIVHKKGKGRKVVLDVHMDEVGFVVTGYNEDGTLKIAALGLVDNKVVPCKSVSIGKNKIPGIIGLKPIHLQSTEESNKIASISSLCIDIGAKSKEEAKKTVNIGDYAVFTTKFEAFGEGLFKGKALDDRVGCAILIELLKNEYNCDLYGVFSVQEEVGGRGAYIAAYDINPDISIILEGTVCGDMPNNSDNKRATELKKGPAISIMDTISIFDYHIIEDIKTVAIRENIPHQIRKSAVGHNDGGSYIMTGSSTKAVTISVPCRYIHSAISVCSKEDYENTIKLTREYLKTL